LEPDGGPPAIDHEHFDLFARFVGSYSHFLYPLFNTAKLP
jgi:hypothetical protein